MATALDIIKRAMRLDRVYGIGETPSADEAQACLDALNSMLDLWATQRLYVYVNVTDVISLAASTASFTIGPTGTTVSVRPVKVLDSSYITYQSVSYPLRSLRKRNTTAYL
jgi:hypothetical protein